MEPVTAQAVLGVLPAVPKFTNDGCAFRAADWASLSDPKKPVRAQLHYEHYVGTYIHARSKQRQRAGRLAQAKRRKAGPPAHLAGFVMLPGRSVQNDSQVRASACQRPSTAECNSLACHATPEVARNSKSRSIGKRDTHLLRDSSSSSFHDSILAES